MRKLDSNNLINNNNNLSNELRNRLLQVLENSQQSILENKEEKLKKFENKAQTEGINEYENIEDYEEINQLLNKLKLEVKRLNQLFWLKEELDELQFVIDFFEARVQNMMRTTLSNLDWYQNAGWKQFLNKEDDLQ